MTPAKGPSRSAVADEAIPLFATLDDDWRGEVREHRPIPRANAPDESRFIALDSEPDSQFLRAQKRVPVRRGAVTRKTANRLKQGCILLGVLLVLAFCATWLYHYAELSPQFRIESSEQITISGAQNVSRSQILEVFGSDIGRDVFFIPVSDRKRQLERIAWVESAAVMRLLPNELRVAIEERKPVAFAQVGPRILLIDRYGVLLEPPATGKAKYSFPVLVGMSEAEPLSTRAPRMKIYAELVHELDSGGAQYSEDLSEVDLRDPEDVKVTVADEEGAVLIHLGDGNFLERFKTYISHVELWRQQYHKLESVDLRFDKQVIVHPDLGLAPASAPQPAPKPPIRMAQAPKPKPSHKPAQKLAIGSHGESTAQYPDRH